MIFGHLYRSFLLLNSSPVHLFVYVSVLICANLKGGLYVNVKFLPPVSAVKVIESIMSVCRSGFTGPISLLHEISRGLILRPDLPPGGSNYFYDNAFPY